MQSFQYLGETKFIMALAKNPTCVPCNVVLICSLQGCDQERPRQHRHQRAAEQARRLGACQGPHSEAHPADEAEGHHVAAEPHAE